ncbi:MAG: BatD family protein, partial [Candidatus Neomarinimicrobiota bacterium]
LPSLGRPLIMAAGTTLFLAAAAAAQPPVQAIVSETKVVEGTSVTLEVRSGRGDIRSVALGGLEDFRIVSGPATSRSVQIINGALSSTSSHTWILLPRRTGTLVIPALAVNVDGATSRTAPVTIEVVPASAAGRAGGASEPVYLVAEVDKRQAYRGEQITVTWTLYTQLNISGWELTSLPNLTGFWTEELFAPSKLQLREKLVNGRRYYTSVVRRQALFPTRSGDLEIDPLAMKVGVRARNRRQRDPFFDDFSIFDRGRVQQKILSSPAVAVKVLPTPADLRPLDYQGMVGRYSLEGQLDPQVVTQDEAATLILKVSGNGNFKALKIPPLGLPRGLELFDPKVSNEPSLGDIVGGTTTVEYVIIPRQAGTFAIAQVSLPYFDPARGRYELATAGPFTLTVRPRPDALATGTGFTRREVALLGKDIRFVKSGRPRWRKGRESWYTPVLLMLNLATVFFFVAPWMGARVRSVATVYGPKLQARRALSSALAVLEKEGDEPGDAHAAISSAVTGYLNQKLGRTTQEYSLRQVGDVLDERQVSPDVRDELLGLLERASAARFAPTGSQDVGTDRAALEAILEQVEAQWRG